MIRTAIITERSRRASSGPPHLWSLGGPALLGRTLRTLAAMGLDEVVVAVRDVSAAQRALNGDGRALRLRWIDRAALAGAVDRDTLLVLADHFLGPVAMRQLLAAARAPGEHVALVDRVPARVFDPERAARARTRNDLVVDLGRDLEEADALSCGAFIVGPDLADSLRAARGDVLLALRGVARAGLLRALPVDSPWVRVSTEEARRHAEWMLRAHGEDLEAHRRDANWARRGDASHTLECIDGLLRQKDTRHYVLLNPGPVLTSPRVKSALVHPDVCHRDSDYSDVVRRLEGKLRRVFGGGPEHAILLLTGSGTAAMEAAVSSSIPPGKKLLVVANGAFGERFGEIADLHDIPRVTLRYAWGELMRPGDVERALLADPAICAVAMVHHETSVGLLNPVTEVGAVCRRHDRLFIVDAVSSLAGEDVDVARDGIDICFSSANKCLHAVSGVSFLCVHERVWERIDDVKPRVYYLDLKRYHHYARNLSQTPFTPAVSTFFALDAALDELLAERPGTRQAQYRARCRRIRAAMAELGFLPLTATGRESSAISSLRVPPDVRFEDLYREMKERGYIVYDSKEHLQGRVVQIANMGELTEGMIDGFLLALRDVVASLRRTRRLQVV
jgi:2-aminoethylphosphonate-pyruvate transaminase